MKKLIVIFFYLSNLISWAGESASLQMAGAVHHYSKVSDLDSEIKKQQIQISFREESNAANSHTQKLTVTDKENNVIHPEKVEVEGNGQLINNKKLYFPASFSDKDLFLNFIAN